MQDSLKSQLESSNQKTVTFDPPASWKSGRRQTIKTIPEDILITDQRPDVSIINRIDKKIELTELSICWDQDYAQARMRKENRYQQLISDLDERGWKQASSHSRSAQEDLPEMQQQAP